MRNRVRVRVRVRVEGVAMVRVMVQTKPRQNHANPSETCGYSITCRPSSTQPPCGSRESHTLVHGLEIFVGVMMGRSRF